MSEFRKYTAYCEPFNEWCDANGVDFSQSASNNMLSDAEDTLWNTTLLSALRTTVHANNEQIKTLDKK